mmetsp:Transcript_16307/g.34986  ORF Transcript_16307/g.34986 Transcript_16307/m.34986 type:complete len:227 (+) Transcript_16307:1843-2523(+)
MPSSAPIRTALVSSRTRRCAPHSTARRLKGCNSCAMTPSLWQIHALCSARDPTVGTWSRGKAGALSHFRSCRVCRLRVSASRNNHGAAHTHTRHRVRNRRIYPACATVVRRGATSAFSRHTGRRAARQRSASSPDMARCRWNWERPRCHSRNALRAKCPLRSWVAATTCAARCATSTSAGPVAIQMPDDRGRAGMGSATRACLRCGIAGWRHSAMTKSSARRTPRR